MTQEDVFLAEILENQGDDTPRRIYADWLLDQNDPIRAARGELIHLQCDLAHFPPGVLRPAPKTRRERQLLEAHGREWGSLFQRLGCHCWEYRRGFVEGIGIGVSAFLTHASTLFRATPLRDLKLYHASGHLDELAASPYLNRVHTLDLEKNELGDGDFEDLILSPHLGNLRTLLLWCNRVGDAGLAALPKATLPCLTRLDLSSNLIGDGGAAVLANSPLLRQLHLLVLTANQIGDSGAHALASTPHGQALEWLDLAKNPINTSGNDALRTRFPGRVQVWG